MAPPLRMLTIHEKYGRLGGAEQHLFVTAPALKQFFTMNFLFWQRTGKDEAAMDFLFDHIYQLNFTDLPQVVKKAAAHILEQSRPDVIYLNKCLCEPLLEAILESGIRPYAWFTTMRSTACADISTFRGPEKSAIAKLVLPACFLAMPLFKETAARDRTESNGSVTDKKCVSLNWTKKLHVFLWLTTICEMNCCYKVMTKTEFPFCLPLHPPSRHFFPKNDRRKSHPILRTSG